MAKENDRNRPQHIQDGQLKRKGNSGTNPKPTNVKPPANPAPTPKKK